MWANFTAWLAKPFSTDMDAFHWLIFFGLLIAISVIWGFILRHTIAGVSQL
jgi:hypothetical protein